MVKEAVEWLVQAEEIYRNKVHEHHFGRRFLLSMVSLWPIFKLWAVVEMNFHDVLYTDCSDYSTKGWLVQHRNETRGIEGGRTGGRRAMYGYDEHIDILDIANDVANEKIIHKAYMANLESAKMEWAENHY